MRHMQSPVTEPSTGPAMESRGNLPVPSLAERPLVPSLAERPPIPGGSGRPPVPGGTERPPVTAGSGRPTPAGSAEKASSSGEAGPVQGSASFEGTRAGAVSSPSQGSVAPADTPCTPAPPTIGDVAAGSPVAAAGHRAANRTAKEGPALSDAGLAALCPMHLVVDAGGRIRRAGPTFTKIAARDVTGCDLFEVLDFNRPSGLSSIAALRQASGIRLRIRLRGARALALSGLVVPLADGGAIVNCGFGIAIVDAVRDHALTDDDFAPTDLAVELLYLVEAKSLAMDILRQMSLRFQGARIVAEEQALTDPLTGLRNRRALDMILARLVETGQEFALMHLDLDHFKTVNDTLGHAAGDHVLAAAARIMIEETRDEDTVARIGGDEFVVIFHRLCDRTRLDEIARRLIARLEAPIDWAGTACRISASAGTAISLDYRQPDPTRMLADADTALYASKHGGRARHSFHRPSPEIRSRRSGGRPED